MRFFQIARTSIYHDAYDRTYYSVHNVTTLAEALKHLKLWEVKDKDGNVYPDGVECTNVFGEKRVQEHIVRINEDGAAQIILRYHYPDHDGKKLDFIITEIIL